jgi:hypothetical protein
VCGSSLISCIAASTSVLLQINISLLLSTNADVPRAIWCTALSRQFKRHRLLCRRRRCGATFVFLNPRTIWCNTTVATSIANTDVQFSINRCAKRLIKNARDDLLPITLCVKFKPVFATKIGIELFLRDEFKEVRVESHLRPMIQKTMAVYHVSKLGINEVIA